MIFLLLVLFQIKHFVCDFPLQTPYMLGKFKEKGWELPLLAHAGVHAGVTFLISLGFTNLTSAFLLAIFDLSVHFTMDRVKASPDLLGRYKALSAGEYRFNSEGLKLQLENRWDSTKTKNNLKENTYFWWALGLDQCVHHLTHYVIIWSLIQ